MKKIYWQNPDAGLLILRIALALLMMVHGWSKLQGFAQMSGSFPDPMGVGSSVSLTLAIFAELGCSVLLLLGALTPLALIPLGFTMLVAAFLIHGGDPWAKKELAVMYLLGYLALLVSGPGRYSVDGKLFGRDDAPSK